MKVTVPRAITTAVLVALTSASLSAEDYQCRKAGGCTASITEDGVVNKVTFRKGDLISTEEGWTVNTRNGWLKIAPGKK